MTSGTGSGGGSTTSGNCKDCGSDTPINQVLSIPYAHKDDALNYVLNKFNNDNNLSALPKNVRIDKLPSQTPGTPTVTTKTYPIPYSHKHDELDYLSGLFNAETGLSSTSADAHEITAPYTTQAPGVTTSHEYVIPYAQKDDATNYLINQFNTATGLTATASDVTIITAPSQTTGASNTTPGDTLKLTSGTPNSSAEILAEVQKQRPNVTLADINLASYVSTPLNIPANGAPTGTPGSVDSVVASVDLTKTGSNIKTINESTNFYGLGFHDTTSAEYISNGAITQVDSHTVRFEGNIKYSLVKSIGSAVINGSTLTAPSG